MPTSFRTLALLLIGSVAAAEASSSPTISVVWQRSGGQGEQILKAFSSGELKALKSGKLREKGPGSDRAVEWKGPLLGSLLDDAMKSLNAEAKSQIDLVVLKGSKGEQAWIPRAFLTRYPMLLAQPGLDSVVPVSSRPKVQGEELPHDTYWIRGVQRVELTNYREQFGRFYLKRRTDPAAVRGEKVFVQNCLGCHGAGVTAAGWAGWESAALAEKLKKHPRKPGFQEMPIRSERALASYWSAYRSEQSESSNR
jgi:mono/diheme cytochrome c family protein